MAKEKLDYSINLPLDANTQISIQLDGEKSRSNLALANTMFGCGVVPDQRIIAKLSHYIAEGHIDMAVKLLNLRPDLSQVIKTFLEQALYRLIGLGEQDKVEIILKLYPEFFFTYAPIKDISGVLPVIDSDNCKGITIFQHAIWAGDVRYMCNMMLDCIPKNAFGEKLRIELLRQCNELMDKGVVYLVDGTEHREKLFSLQPLIDALQFYLEQLQNWTAHERTVNWCSGIGILQRRLPAIIRHHYCNPENSFWYDPDFYREKLVRSIKFIFTTEEQINIELLWDDSLVDLGTKFAISAKPWSFGEPLEVAAIECGEMTCDLDLAALRHLCVVGTKIDLPLLMQRLQSPIQILDEDLNSRVLDFS